jgi:hypothetical protein
MFGYHHEVCHERKIVLALVAEGRSDREIAELRPTSLRQTVAELHPE